MEYLIKEAFLHVDVYGPHVANGEYDLLGPHDEIIMKHVWETMIQPGWEISMHMWPIPEPPAEGDLLAEGLGDIVIVDEGAPPPPPPVPSAPGFRAVDGTHFYPPLTNRDCLADIEQIRKVARKRRKRFRSSWVGLLANRRRNLRRVKAGRSNDDSPILSRMIYAGDAVDDRR